MRRILLFFARKSRRISGHCLSFALGLLAPGEGAGALVEPAVLARHLARARVAVAEEPDCQNHDRVDDIVVQRQERALEEGVVEEAHDGREHQHRRDALPDRPPGDGDGAPGHPGRPAAHGDRHQAEEPEGGFLVEDALHGFSSCYPLPARASPARSRTPSPIMTAPASRSCQRMRPGRRAIQSPTVPAAKAVAASTTRPHSFCVAPRTSSWTATDPLAGSTNWGRKASMKTSTLGLVRFEIIPSRKALRGVARTGLSAASPRRRRRMSLRPR